MTGRAGRVLLALTAFFALTAQRDPILVPEVSQHEIQVRQGFTGTELLLFGAILDPDGRRAQQPYDIVVVLKGPTQMPSRFSFSRSRIGWVGPLSTTTMSYGCCARRPSESRIAPNSSSSVPVNP